MTNLQERVRSRIKGFVDQHDVSHETLGAYLGLTRSAVTRLLNDEGAGIALQHIERLCEYFQVTPSELMAEPGAMIQVVKPLESQLLKIFREMTELERRGLLDVLDRQPKVTGKHRASRKPAQLSADQKALLSLYARSNARAREGVMKILNGAAVAAESMTILGTTE